MEHGRAPLIWNPDINKGKSLYAQSLQCNISWGSIKSRKRCPQKVQRMHVAWSSCTSQVCCLGCCKLCTLAADTLKHCTHRDRVHRGGAKGEGVCYAPDLLSLRVTCQCFSSPLRCLFFAHQYLSSRNFPSTGWRGCCRPSSRPLSFRQSGKSILTAALLLLCQLFGVAIAS